MSTTFPISSITALIQAMSSDSGLPTGSRVSLRNSDRTGLVSAVSGAGHVEIEFDDAPAGDTEVVSVDALVLIPPTRKLAVLVPLPVNLDDVDTMGTVVTRFAFGATTDPDSTDEDELAAWMQAEGV